MDTEKDLKQQQEEQEEEQKNKDEVVEDDNEFIESLLGANLEEEEDLSPEEKQRRKNKDAEEARKRREAEAKEKAEKEKREAEEKAQKEEEAKKALEEKNQEAEERNRKTNLLGEQLIKFKDKYPQVDLKELDNDKHFKKYINGKLLGKQDFTNLYEEYVEFKAELVGVEKETIQRNYQKASSSSGSSKSNSEVVGEIYSEEELRKLSERLPFMSRKEAAKIEDKLNRSINYYKK